jgi:hypothetical protein
LNKHTSKCEKHTLCGVAKTLALNTWAKAKVILGQ